MRFTITRATALSLSLLVAFGACSPPPPPPHPDASEIRPVSELSSRASSDFLSVRYCAAIMGQSNGAGRKFIEQVSAPQHDILVGNFAHVPISEWESSFTSPFTVLYNTADQTGTQQPVRPDGPLSPRPYTLVPNAVPNMGAELSLGHGLDPLAANRWGVIKCNVGGTSLATEWCPTCTYPAAAPNNLYGFCTNFVKQRAAALGCTVAVILWIQGESDACTTPLSTGYQAELTALFNGFRSIWPRVAIVLNRLSSSYTGCGDATMLAAVRAAQLAVVGSMARTGWVDSDGLLLDSGIHFVPDGYVTLGYRFVPVVINAMGFAFPPTASWSVVAQNRTATFTDQSSDPNMGSQVNPAVGGTIATYLWDLGDGTTSTLQNPVHTYAGDGSYTVKETVRNSVGIASSSTQVVTIALPTWTVDGTSNTGFPSTSAEWVDFESKHSDAASFGVPSDLYLFQQASGTIGDVTGAHTLSVAGTPTYQKSIAGFARKAVGGSGATASQNANNTTFTNVNATSWSALAVVRWDPSTGGNRPILALGASGVNELETAGSTTSLRYRNGANGTNGTLSESGVARVVYLQQDMTHGSSCVWTETEKVCPTFTQGAGTSAIATFSTTSDGTSADFLYLARWQGSAAERGDADVRVLLRGLGYNPRGY